MEIVIELVGNDYVAKNEREEIIASLSFFADDPENSGADVIVDELMADIDVPYNYDSIVEQVKRIFATPSIG